LQHIATNKRAKSFTVEITANTPEKSTQKRHAKETYILEKRPEKETHPIVDCVPKRDLQKKPIRDQHLYRKTHSKASEL